MLNSREGRVFVELNYPHIIDIRGYERHHDMATWPRGMRPNSSKIHAAIYLFACTNRAKPSIRSSVPIFVQTHGKPWRTKGGNRFKTLRASQPRRKTLQTPARPEKAYPRFISGI